MTAPDVTFTQLRPDGDDRFQRLRPELGLSTFGLNLMRLAPGQRGRIHAHRRQEEVYVVLEGTLTLLIEERPHELGRLAVARVAPEVRRQLVNRGDVPCVLLALGGAEPHEGRDGVAFESWAAHEGRPPQDLPLPPDLAPDER